MTAAAFVACFVLLWLLVCVILGFFSGWYLLMRAFPDRPHEEPLAVFKHESGMLGPVSMSRILRLSPCPSGLRVGIMKLFGPFSKDFLVPWDLIGVSRKKLLVWKYAELSFGTTYGRLRISDLLVDRLWQSAPQNWPEKGMPEPVTGARRFQFYFVQWLTLTTIAAVFFIIAPRTLAKGSGNYPPVLVAILFPAIAIGLFSALQYLASRR
jgi:hypothetical protein